MNKEQLERRLGFFVHVIAADRGRVVFVDFDVVDNDGKRHGRHERSARPATPAECALWSLLEAGSAVDAHSVADPFGTPKEQS